MKQFTLPLFLLALLLTPYPANAAQPQVSKYMLDIEFVPAQGSMHGQSTMRFNGALRSGDIHFYLHGELEVESVALNGAAIGFRSEPVYYDADYSLVADKVSFELDEPVEDAELVVTYGGHFHPSSARSRSDYMRIDPDGVFLRAFGYSLWFPVFLEADDDVRKADFPNVRFKIPRQYELVFVGEKTAEQLTPEYAITSWRVNGAELWDLQVTAGEFRQLASGKVRIYYLDDEASALSAKAVAGFTQNLLAFYRDHYRQDAGMDSMNLVEMPEFGNISSHNMVGIASSTFRAFEHDIYSKRTIAHELVHPFVSLQVSRSDPLWSLAIEGFPSFFHLPGLRHVLGDDFYRDFLLKVQKYYLDNKGVATDRRGSTRPPEVPLLQIAAENLSDYKDDYILWGRSKLFFNYLLKQMGESTFAAFAKDLFNRQGLTEPEFIALCEQYLPHHQAQVHTWLYSNAFPDEFRIE